MTRPFQDAALDLLQGRGRALKSDIARLGSRYDGLSESGFTETLAKGNRKDRAVVGLLLSEQVLSQALVGGSVGGMQKFVFRFGAHLKASVSSPGISSPDRVVLATAARQVFQSHPSLKRQVAEAEQILERLPEGGETAGAWRRQFGMTEDEFNARVAVLSSAWREVEPAQFNPDMPARRPSRLIDVEGPASSPSWLSFSTGGSKSLAASRNWGEIESDGPDAVELDAAWSLFDQGEYPAAQAHLWPLFASVGLDWSPSRTPDGARSWNWLRLVWLLAEESLGRLKNRRRSLVSAAEAASRAVPDHEDLATWLADQSLRDYVAVEATFQSDWAVHAARLVAALGPSTLDVYSAEQKAVLRQTWEEHFGEIVSDMRQTYQMVEALTSEMKFRRKELLQAADADDLTSRRIIAPLRRIEPFLDSEETRIVRSWQSTIPAVIAYLANEDPAPNDGTSVLARCDILASQIALSESLLLQDALGPALRTVRSTCMERDTELKSGSQPHITAELVQNRLPLSSTVVAPFNIDIRVRNEGNAVAELIEVQVASLAIEIDDPSQVIDRIAPGSQRSVSFVGRSLADAEIAQLQLDLTWRDHLDQVFSDNVEVRVEDQRQSSWRSDDVNPFKLGTIANPDQLVGRQEDLDALGRVLAGGGSASVTGLKRVGKSSLAKSLLTRMSIDGWATAFLPLGQVLSGSPSAAQFTSALLETIFDAVEDCDAGTLPPLPEFIDENFARVAGRWIRQASTRLSRSGRHVLIAIDDFDELPSVLYRGDEADALFLFMRSVIDEPWLSLIVIGSEVLPSIISAQAHKLNQVSPVIVSNFKSVDATRLLLEGPTTTDLEWQEMAFSRAHFLAAGNPYYLTLLGQSIWQKLRDLDRTYVSIGDVNDASVEISESGSPAHFVHLWADSTEGLDASSRSSLVSGAVLRAVAHASGSDFQFVRTQDISEIATTWLPDLKAAEFASAIANLTSRTVLMPKNETYRLAIPLSSLWLTREGGRELDKDFAAVRERGARVRQYSSLDLVRLTREIVFCGDAISEVRLAAWIEQFPEDFHNQAYSIAKRLLEEGYFSNARMTQEILPRLKRSIQSSAAWGVRLTDKGGYAKNVYLLSHGQPGSSSHSVTANLAKLLKVKKTNIVSVDQLITASRNVSQETVLVVADDFVGSGNQLRGVVSDTLSRLSSTNGSWRDNLRMVVAAGISASTVSLEDVEVASEFVVGEHVGPRLMVTSGEAGIFDDDEQRHLAVEVIDTIGGSLSPGRPRGFGDMGLLVVTEQNCPNNTLPILWKAGLHAGEQWLPLFERRL